MPAWLSRLFGTVKRISKLYNRERFTRFDFLIVVFCIGIIVFLGGHLDSDAPWSFQGLAIIAGIVIAVAFLLYLPKASLLIAAAIGCVFFIEEPKAIPHWQTPTLLWIILGFIWVTWLVYFDDHLILKQLDIMHEKVNSLHEKIEAMQEKLEEIEAKQDEMV